MVDLIIAAVLLLGGTSAAEWLRRSFRRRLETPIPARTPTPPVGKSL
jgi:hypothetical protein